MQQRDEIRRMAIAAMKAVTAGALLCAGLSCSPNPEPADDKQDDSSAHRQSQQSEQEPTQATIEADEEATSEPDETAAVDNSDDRDLDDHPEPDDSDEELSAQGIEAQSDEDADSSIAADGDDTVCNSVESTGVCPEGCTTRNDVDCCNDHFRCRWSADSCVCAISGPFVPPTLVV